MGQILYGSAATTEAVRRSIQNSQESLRALSSHYGINQKTVAKWKKRSSVADLPTGPKEVKSTVLSSEEEAVIVAFRRHTLLPLDDCLYASAHIFGRVCRENEIDHRLTKIKHPWTNGQVERMNRTTKEATVQRYYYESHDQFRQHLADFVNAYNFARRLKALRGLTPYEFICKCWTNQPERFKFNPLHQMAGLNT